MRLKLVVASLLVAFPGAIGRPADLRCTDVAAEPRRLHSCDFRVYPLVPQVQTSPPQQSEPYTP